MIYVCIFMKNLLDVRFHGRLQLLVHYLPCFCVFFSSGQYDYLQFVKSIAKGKGKGSAADRGLSAGTKAATTAANTSVKICLNEKASFECDLLRNTYYI